MACFKKDILGVKCKDKRKERWRKKKKLDKHF